MPSPNGSLHAEYSASGLASTIARLRDAVRAFRGKRPKYSSLALQWFADQHAQGFGPTANGRGIASEADVAVGALTPEEQKQLRLIVESVADHPGPIVHVG
ncbi:MAG: hypothetical protein IT424_09350, partial [Pirellulales bacterium]|nr:hypothetical protein [Pirellulales bacterium]